MAWTRAKAIVRSAWAGIGRVDFGTRIVIFGASMLLSVLPLVVLLSSYASHRVDVDISRHLALSPQGQRLVRSLFTSAPGRVDLAILVSLVLSFAGAISVARSVQTGYEAVFETTPARGPRNLLFCLAWVAVTGGLLIADGFIAPHIGSDAWRTSGYRIVELVTLYGFFLWTMYFLLRAALPLRRFVLPAFMTSVLWLGLRAFSALYFSPSLVSDGHTYGTVGVIFTLMTWFIAIDAVVLLGAIVGVAIVAKGPTGDAADPIPAPDVSDA